MCIALEIRTYGFVHYEHPAAFCAVWNALRTPAKYGGTLTPWFLNMAISSSRKSNAELSFLQILRLLRLTALLLTAAVDDDFVEDFGAVVDEGVVEVRNAELVPELVAVDEDLRAELVPAPVLGDESGEAELVVRPLEDVVRELGVEAFEVDVRGLPLAVGTLELADTVAEVEGLPLL